ncbi:MAG: hypothetical protein M3457_08260 [Chloroflexota bacterium]|nr:hypothetical protein [Chloroflexota bacterium]
MAEIEASGETFFPEGLAGLLAPLLAHDIHRVRSCSPPNDGQVRNAEGPSYLAVQA